MLVHELIAALADVPPDAYVDIEVSTHGQIDWLKCTLGHVEYDREAKCVTLGGGN